MKRNICIEAFVKAGMLTIINTKVIDYLIVVLYNFFSSRMPAERRSARGRSAVGRFPSVTFGFGEDTEAEKEEPKENNVKKGNACKEWLRKVCPCCCPKHDDGIDTEVTLVDGPGKEDGGNGEKPVPGDKELDGD